MKLKLFTLLILAALIVTTAGTALAQGPRPPAGAAAANKPESLRTNNYANQAAPSFTDGTSSSLTYGAIVNGDFEQGRLVGWSEYSSQGWKLVVDKPHMGPYSPHAGTWAAWLAGDNNETSVITQSGVTITSPGSMLYVWYFIHSDDDCGYDYGYVKVNSDVVYTWNLCTSTNTNGWKNQAIDLSAYDGQTVNISIIGQTDVGYISDLIIDDVVLGGPTFADVPAAHPYYQDIQILYLNGLTGGCSTDPMRYCPDQSMDRAQSGVFMLRGNFGNSFLPGAATHIFADDWSKGPWAEPWAEAMYTNGLSAGCGSTPLMYCPWVQMPREQAVVFALRLKYGNNYLPPVATGQVFADLTDVNYYATRWAEQAYADGLIPACGTSGGKPMFCPKTLVSRGLGAYMIVRAKNLSMP